MLQLRIYSPTGFTEQVVSLLREDPFVSNVALMRGASLEPEGDLVFGDVAREAANGLISRLQATGVHEAGDIQIGAIDTALSRRNRAIARTAPGHGSDAVVWVQVEQRSYEESALTWAYLAFISLAALIAAIGIELNSIVLIIGAMVVGPEFGPIAAAGLALARRRLDLLRRALWALIIGFAVAITFTYLAAELMIAIGWLKEPPSSSTTLPGLAFAYSPDKWSFIVAFLAGTVGMLALTSNRSGALVGVFISVTTVPAAGNAALSLAFTQFSEFKASMATLCINIGAMSLAGFLTLIVLQRLWSRVERTREAAREPF